MEQQQHAAFIQQTAADTSQQWQPP
ncbi:hypothetical protein A2U01_0069758, partial [Trifolium medium]|nr:hypothetical protein [Trifolium medium]